MATLDDVVVPRQALAVKGPAPPVPQHSWGTWGWSEGAGSAAAASPLAVMNGAVPPSHGAFDLPPPRGEGARGIKDIFVALENQINAISPAAGSPTPSGPATLGKQREAGTPRIREARLQRVLTPQSLVSQRPPFYRSFTRVSA